MKKEIPEVVTEHLVDTNASVLENQFEVRGAGERDTYGAFSTYSIKYGDEEQLIKFQRGRDDANGLTDEVLLAILKHRFECRANGRFPSKADEVALGLFKPLLFVLHLRVAERLDVLGIKAKLGLPDSFDEDTLFSYLKETLNKLGFKQDERQTK